MDRENILREGEEKYTDVLLYRVVLSVIRFKTECVGIVSEKFLKHVIKTLHRTKVMIPNRLFDLLEVHIWKYKAVFESTAF